MSDRRQDERRKHARRSTLRRRPRFAVPGMPVRLRCDSAVGKTVLAGRLLDISPTGVRLIVEGAVGVNELLLIETRLAAGCLNLSARVAWARPHEQGFAVGCKLTAPPAGEKLMELRRL